jgi:ABC-type sugar transport system ATPase subunit
MDEIFRISDRITVLRDGRTIASLDAAAATPAHLIRLMVGRELTAAERTTHATGDTLLSVRLPRITFDLHRGEVLGIAGLVGSGRSSLGAALVRQYPDQVVLLPEDRRTQGLMPDMSVVENATLAVLPRVSRLGFVRRAAERRAFAPIATRLALRAPSVDAPVATLSGGNQQKVLLARWLLRDAPVLFLDDPTRGIDVAAKQDIYRAIQELAAAGKGVILVSSELPELLACSDRIAVLHNRRLAAVYDAREATQEQIMAAATQSDG